MKTIGVVVSSLLALLSSAAFSAERCSILVSESSGTVAQSYSEAQVRDLARGTETYQDRRNEQWTDRQKCLCCHTTLPYVLNRKYDADSKQSLDKMMTMTKASVLNNLENPWYRADEAGRDSRPTESVLNSLTLLMYDINVNHNMSDVTKKSISQIFEHMDSDGKIHWLDYKLEPFESKQGENWGNALAILTIEMAGAKFGYIETNPKFEKLKQNLLSKKSDFKIQEKSVLLWADSLSGSVPGAGKLLSLRDRTKFIGDSRAAQNSDGSWSQHDVLGMGSVQKDVYATSIALIGLINAGLKGTQEVKLGVNWLMQNRVVDENGNFSFKSLSLNRPQRALNNTFSTDVATSYAALALKMFAEHP